jgi:ribosomal protein S18 acetylase RimI-like enzyme
MVDYMPLDNPAWSSLTTGHRTLARINGDAARYPEDISPLAALREGSRKAFDQMRELTRTGEIIGFVTAYPLTIPDDWEVVLAREIDQMVCEKFNDAGNIAALELSAEDVPEMIALTKLTQPGPFEHGTIGMGRYIGIRDANGALIAMCGQRMAPEGFREISAVCTHPDHQGKGLAGKLMTIIARDIVAEGRMPFLHVKTENGARRLYEKLGFRVRRAMKFNVVRKP